MDKDRVKGTVDEVVGRAKRQVGEWTGDTDTQAEGAIQQIKGKVENTVGKIKDAARDAKDKIHSEHEKAVDDAAVDAEVERRESIYRH